jgi:propionyl-CoA carboxylase alpha chain
MGDKIQSKRTAQAAGVSCVPGHIGEVADGKHAVLIAEEIGYPVMVKASAGGGGKGIRIAANRREVEEGFSAVRAEARNAFGDDRVFIEKFVRAPRHVEIQVMGDRRGNVVHLFERECSIQRRNQKVIEEAPSPLLDEKTRAEMGAQAVALAKAVDYDSAGTVEFVASGADRSFYFLEMNTRLQVEHPVTEMIAGVDLVELMIRAAAGEALPFKQKDLKIDGWAMETRLYAEDPYRNFLPSIGRLRRYRPPAEKEGVLRIDSGVREGDEVSMFYDPMIAKLVTRGKDRAAVMDAQAQALDAFVIEGIQDNIPFLCAVMGERTFRSGKFTTAYIKELFPDGFQGVAPNTEQTDLLAACAVFAQALASERARQIAGRIAQNGNGGAWVVSIAGGYMPARIVLNEEGAAIVIGDGKEKILKSAWRPGQPLMEGVFAGGPFAVKINPRGEGFQLRTRGVDLVAIVTSRRGAELHKRLPEKKPADLSKFILSPMPGLIVSIDVATGQEVKTGEGVAIVEAMKMQNIIRAERDGVVAKINVAAGASVMADEVLLELA